MNSNRHGDSKPAPDNLPPYAPVLSQTERRVCAYLLQGLTEKQIAELLERSPNTIHTHVRNIYRTLAVSSRKELQVYPGIIRLVLGKKNNNSD